MVIATDGQERPDDATAASSVADRLAGHILEQLPPGSRLPSEADLARHYQVSRLTMREAVKILAGRGLLELSRGRRAVVREPDGAILGDFLVSLVRHDPKGIFDLLDVRRALEVQSAMLAARHASRAALAALEGALQGMRDAAADMAAGTADPMAAASRFHAFDMGFHEALALAGGNRVLIFLFEAMAATLLESFAVSNRGQGLRGHTAADTIAAHERILQAVTQGNARKAADAMRSHLGSTETDIRAALAPMGPGSAASAR